MNGLYAALAAACLVGGASAAQAGSGQNPILVNGPQPREVVTLAVSTAGRDLKNPEEAIALRARAARDIARVCNPVDRLKADLSPDWRCRHEMAASLELALRQSAAREGSRGAAFADSGSGTLNPR